MHIGFLTDGLGHLPLDEAMDTVQGLGLTEIEIATGNWSNSPHVDLPTLVADKAARTDLTKSAADRGLKIGALNCSGNIFHPETGATQTEVVMDTMRVAGEMGIDRIVMMSGLPAVNDTDKVVPWIVTCWPAENGPNLEKQWQKAVDAWGDLADFAKAQGIAKIALEMHADQLVWNPPTLLRLRNEIGSIIGANLDPSHLMWMGADPVECARALDGAIHHVHAKDTRIEELAKTRTLLEPLFFDKRDERAWNYITIGEGHPGGLQFWSDFARTVQASGYDGVLSIEHEDVAHTPEEGLKLSVDLLTEAIKPLG